MASLYNTLASDGSTVFSFIFTGEQGGNFVEEKLDESQPLLMLVATPTLIFKKKEGKKESNSQDWRF